MIKYCFKVFDKSTGEMISQVITNCDNMIETLKSLGELGVVKGFILDEKENENGISDL